VVEFMLAGATACALGTATLSNPRAALEIIEDLPSAISSCGGRAASELTGALKVKGEGAV
ncbi:MAG: dihydroorotate dehydrogenase, partial [Actinomycetota bacterium]|nr:dihydroorotate dehydrogenase [Actinomycetota bacterium]